MKQEMKAIINIIRVKESKFIDKCTGDQISRIFK